ncbi:MAG: HAD-IB family phosphatase [Cyanobacteria bacterium P01_H01_bin.15]
MVEPIRDRVVFCDFDGTITTVDTFVEVTEKFVPPAVMKALLPRIYARELTLKEGVKAILEAIPAIHYADILKLSLDMSIRPGLSALLDFLDAQDVPLVVISSGIRGVVETVLSHQPTSEQPLIERVLSVNAADVVPGEKFLAVSCPWESASAMMDKVKVMQHYPAREQVAIGDGITDVEMALHADWVFARDRLVGYLQAELQPFESWETFFDVRDALAVRWQASPAKN